MRNNYDLSICKNSANSFLQVAKKIEDELDFFLDGGMYPFTVNASFACELYLKTILLYSITDEKIPKTHDLGILFNALPNNVKKQIEVLFNNQFEYDLQCIILEISTAFVDWRYAFEKSVKINVTGILAFASALREYVEQTIR